MLTMFQVAGGGGGGEVVRVGGWRQVQPWKICLPMNMAQTAKEDRKKLQREKLRLDKSTI